MMRAGLCALMFVAACGDEVPGRDRETQDTDTVAPLVCARPVDGESRMLVNHDLWRLATAAEDPWVEFRPGDDIACPSGARKTEDFAGTYAYSVITLGCSYTTVVQETLADACAGEELYVWMWNYALTAPADSTAFLGVQVGADRVWEDTRAIPSASALEATRVTLTRDVPKGTPIFFHVRNHGANSYELLELSIVGDELPAP